MDFSHIPPVPTQRRSMINKESSYTDHRYTATAYNTTKTNSNSTTLHDSGNNDVEMDSFYTKEPYHTSYEPYVTGPTYTNYQEPLIQQKPLPRQPQPQKRAPKTIWQKLLQSPFTIIVTIVDIALFIYELAEMSSLTGSAFQTEPYFNPMLGPSSYVQIYIGSRFSPCMYTIEGYTDTDTITWPCPNSTTTDTDVCSLAELCNFSDGTTTPYQTWRLLSSCFLHAGFVHILFNLVLQLTMGREMEIELGPIRYTVLYIASGLSGNLFGADFAGDGISSSGASGALFGVIGANLLSFIFHKNKRMIRSYKLILFLLVAEIIVSLVLGLLPGLDNFAHIGGLVCGLLLGVAMMDNPIFVKIKPSKQVPWREKYSTYKKKQFWIWTAIRVVCFVLLVVWYATLAVNLQKGGGNCSWCQYLSCLPVNDWCSSQDLSTETSSSN